MILIVDDDFINRESFKKVISSLNKTNDLFIMESNDGEKAVESFKKHNETYNN